MAETLTQVDAPALDRTQLASPSYAPPFTADTLPFRAAGDRYEIGPEIARGGMGAVHRGRDAAFGREVAVKLLLNGPTADSPPAARFFDEARIAGQLQHPGIPPIYDVGTLPDGRPFLAMKLIQGKTLEAALRDGDPLNVAAVFEGVCQAVGYAHSRRVIHRDLKPQNVMVGAFGEVQVMDWGLAKVLAGRDLDRPEPADTTTAIVSGRVDGTRVGAVMGSPPFLPPEQARGMLDEIDERSDVFGLGGILCVLLTGQPVYVCDSVFDTVIMAERAVTLPAFDRLDGCGADPELTALCKRCLSARKADRPADGNAVATEVAALRAAAEARAKQAETDRATAAVRAEEEAKRRAAEADAARRRLRLQSWAAAAVCTALLAGAAGTGWQALAARAEAGRANDEAGRAGIEAAHARAAEATATQREQEAVAARDAARDRYKLALDGISELVLRTQEELKIRPGTAELQQKLLRSAQARLGKLLEAAETDRLGADSTVVWAHIQMGDVALMLGDTQQAKAEYVAAHALAEKMAAADPASALAQRNLFISLEKLGDIHLKLGDTAAARRDYLAEYALAEKLAAADPASAKAQQDWAYSLDRMGDMHRHSGNPTAARQFYLDGLAVRQKLVAADPASAKNQRNLSTSYCKLGDLHRQLGDIAAARKWYQDGLAIDQKLAAADPASALAQKDLSVGYDRMGDVHLELGDSAAARQSYLDALAVSQRLAAADPTSAQAQMELLISFYKLGQLAAADRDFTAAVGWHEKALAVADGSAKPEFFVNQRRALKNLIAEGRAKAAFQPREPAPPPRPVR